MPRIGTEIFPDANAPLLRLRLRAPAGTRVEETERIVLRTLWMYPSAKPAKDNVAITSDFVGVVPSSYPVNLIHLFTSGPQEASHSGCAQAGSHNAARHCANAFARAFAANCPASPVSFEAGDIVTQVMSFGSPTPIEVAVQGVESGG